jgi:hypothetical protein
MESRPERGGARLAGTRALHVSGLNEKKFLVSYKVAETAITYHTRRIRVRAIRIAIVGEQVERDGDEGMLKTAQPMVGLIQ